MKKKALFVDLDNTIYAVSTIGNELNAKVYTRIDEHGGYVGDLEQIKLDIQRTPFQKVASHYRFSADLASEAINLLQNLTCTMKMTPFEDYEVLRGIPCRKFLITTGFTNLQQSKIHQLGIANDFEERHIVDPQLAERTKKDVFLDILQRHHLDNTEVLVIGDDPNSELKAAQELGIEAVLYDKVGFNPELTHLNRITDFSELLPFL